MAELTTNEYVLSTEAKLKNFVREVLEKVGVERSAAEVVADVLVAADERGVESHGVARLESYYVSRIRSGKLNPKPNYHVARETETTVVYDADNGLGHPVGKLTMEAVIEKARKHGSAFGAVCNSNHFGIAGYYAMLALPHDMIGMA
ncbi:MAG: Ldh family oxidoreductase, partial [Candidatus Eremiobacteraeota bacterium]|nr:Ldh family oxidoreductase [Candidatus Eremiobacteraeota bacterium]